MTHDLESELIEHLRNAHAMEEQSLRTLRAAEKAAGDPRYDLAVDAALAPERHKA